MIRSSRLSLKFSNQCKIDLLDKAFEVYQKCLQDYIDKIWTGELPLKDKLSSKILPSNIISDSSYKNSMFVQASGIIKSQRKKKKKTKPEIKNCSMILNYHLFDVEINKTSFDMFLRIKLPFKKENGYHCQTIKVPLKKHKQFNKFKDWTRKNTIQINKINSVYYVTFFFEKETIEIISNDKLIGLDSGYKKLLVSSSGQVYGKELEKVYSKIARKKRNSKNYKKSLTERTNKTNQEINRFFDKEQPSTVIIEDLKNAKKDTKKDKTINSKFMNKLQYWTYSRVIQRIINIAEERGIKVVKVSPAYTSQQCSSCGAIHKESRSGEKFLCVACGYEIDADLNAAINIHNKGVIDPSPPKDNF